MKRGHLTKRGMRGRVNGWARMPRAGSGGAVASVCYRLATRMSTTQRTVCHDRHFPADTERRHIAATLRGMRAQLRWARDQMDFEALGIVDTTPAPAVMA